MKIQCPKCKTLYKISEAKIPEKGVYLRCKKCGSRIFVKGRKNSQNQQRVATRETCLNCGYVRLPGDVECPKCGAIYFKLEEQLKIKKEKERQEALEKKRKEIRKLKRKEKIEKYKKLVSKNKSALLAIIIILSVIITGVSITVVYCKSKKLCIKKYHYVLFFMRLSFNECCTVCNEYSSVWRRAIENERDFNLAILRHKIELEKNGTLKKIRNQKEIISKGINELNEKSELFPKCNKKLLELYGIYCELEALALCPSGTLISFNNKVDELTSRFIRVESQLSVLLPRNN